jgi:hypothetical protein
VPILLVNLSEWMFVDLVQSVRIMNWFQSSVDYNTGEDRDSSRIVAHHRLDRRYS